MFPSLVSADDAVSRDADWKVVTEQDGVTVSSKDNGDGGLPRVRAEAVIDAHPLTVLAVLHDIESHTEWRSRCIEARTLTSTNEGGLLAYIRNRGRWPVADRDVVVEAEVTIGNGAREIWLRLESVDSPLMPLIDGVVRMPKLSGYYFLEALSSTRTRFVHEVSADLGGRIPGWVTRIVTRDMPLETTLNLRRQIARADGRYDETIGEWMKAHSPSAEPH